MEDLNITLLQVPLIWESKEANLRLFSERIDGLKEKTDLIVLPEMFSTGFTMNSAQLAETMDGSAVAWMREQASKLNCVICGSLIIQENATYFNRLIWMEPNGKIQYYDKRHLFRMANENEHYSEGKRKVIVVYKGWKIALQVCYDLRFPVWSRRTNAENYDLLLYVANWPERRNHAWKSLLVARAIENQSYVLGVNRVGYDGNNISYTGDSVLLNYLGEALTSVNPGEESICNHTIAKENLLAYRKNFPAELDADSFSILA